ncbi:MAG: PBSX family phage terminase large subunit [Cyanobacteria bacterium J06638_20]
MGRAEKLDKFTALLEAAFSGSANADLEYLIDQATASLADWAAPLLSAARYKCLYGGRGSGKSFGAADALLIEACRRPVRVLCGREFQNSIAESVHQLLCDRIEALGLDAYFRILESKIYGPHGSEFFFRGLRHNINSIKSIPGITHVWIEEAETTSQKTWDVLVPTIRNRGSEIWVTFNPNQESDPMYQLFVEHPERLAGEHYIRQVNWRDNPHFPPELAAEREAMLATDPDRCEHIYEGKCWQRSDAQVLGGKWIVQAFEPGNDWDGPYYGADWGFAQDPTTAVKLWIYNKRLFWEYESVGVGWMNEEIATHWKRDIPGIEKHVVYGDNARPETIAHVRREGISRLTAADKWPGSVEDGIAFLRSFEQIVYHPRCKHSINEARLWAYKVDRLTGNVLPKLLDGNDHCHDGGRYALCKLIRKRERTGSFDLTPISYG